MPSLLAPPEVNIPVSTTGFTKQLSVEAGSVPPYAKKKFAPSMTSPQMWMVWLDAGINGTRMPDAAGEIGTLCLATLGDWQGSAGGAGAAKALRYASSAMS